MESILQNENEVKKPLEVWQGIVGFFVVLSIVVGLYGSQISSVKASATTQENHELRIRQLEVDRSEMKQDIKDIRASQLQDGKETRKSFETITILLKDKQDRK